MVLEVRLLSVPGGQASRLSTSMSEVTYCYDTQCCWRRACPESVAGMHGVSNIIASGRAWVWHPCVLGDVAQCWRLSVSVSAVELSQVNAIGCCLCQWYRLLCVRWMPFNAGGMGARSQWWTYACIAVYLHNLLPVMSALLSHPFRTTKMGLHSLVLQPWSVFRS
ncbi:hypothetical protein DUNSADRAFT_4994 [Dunaliella salina]|uniref:Encoded protein n=1 Tax=Dunaliella salina TaxID=3046 RepID=A0ABQ7GQZ2_DUNSA|nr:hypothetical protein DUNSADRAFT_4994 [Dunaliella salina]|eukprot:KAF5836972.1 hypothetical protein DUNSADRAFT_4994 [Dunaliella salina]